MKLEYIGPKADGERHLKEKSGIEWMPGSVHQVSLELSKEFLQHPTSWKLADDQSGVVLSAAATVAVNPGIPSWAKEGIDAGLTDEQLESIAVAGGPETENGAKLWLELTGKAYGNLPPADPVNVIRLPDGMTRILDGMDKGALHTLAKELGVAVHHNAGADKVTAAIVAAYPVK